jgi:4-amino-4-deoxy-L-arabinose transferase-like glycosyltransferase
LLLAAFLRLHRLAAVPFGWHPDEATKALLARDVLAGKYFPPFFSAFTGREALFVYLEALLFALQGESIFSGRLLAAFTGILTVALTYITGRMLFNRRTGLLAAALLAVSLWHLIASRNGYRAVIQPLIQLPVILALFYGLRRNRGGAPPQAAWAPCVVAGIFLGLSQYTYTAVRLFPFLIVALVLLTWLFARPVLRGQWRYLLLTGLVAFLVFLPLGWYFWQHPNDFFGRAAQISVFSPEWSGGDSGSRLWQSARETARMWTVWGDINYRFNISGQPVFGPLEGTLFYLGLPLALWRAYRARGLRRVAYLLLPVWLAIMLLPMLLSAESLPYYQRAIGTLPAVYFFPAIALDTAVGCFNRRTEGRWSAGVTAVFVLFTGLLALSTYHDYFVNWHLDPRNDDDRRVAMVYVANYLAGQEEQGNLYLSTQYSQHPTLALLAQERFDGIHWFDARQSLPLPPPGEEATYVLLAENAPNPWLLERVEGMQELKTGLDRFGRDVFSVYAWPGGPMPVPGDTSSPTWSWATTFAAGAAQPGTPLALPVNFGETMFLLGHDRRPAAPGPGDALELILHWDLGPKPSRQYTIFAHLLNAEGQVVSGFDANEYPTSFWREEGGERLLSFVRLPLPGDLQPGTYQVEIGVYNQASGERLGVLEHGQQVADRLLLAPVEIQ